MLEDFAKRKFGEYNALIEFPGEEITLQQIRHSNLPPYIINFLDLSYSGQKLLMSQEEFSKTLNRAIVFNINYVLKPKKTILKFLFGDFETRTADHIRDRLRYFQFYSYYINFIAEFMNMNSLHVISVDHIEHLINEVNKKILSEISEHPSGDSSRINLIKLLYYFFMDLAPNNPVNLKLPKNLLSTFFYDKGFAEMKIRVDGFFAGDIFIQEAVELMRPRPKRAASESDPALEEQRAREILKKAKEDIVNPPVLIDDSASDRDVRASKPADEEIPQSYETRDVELPDLLKRETRRIITPEKIYSEDPVFSSIENEIAAKEFPGKEISFAGLISELFCEVSYRKKIIRKVFKKDEAYFSDSVAKILGTERWDDATVLIEEIFGRNKVDFFSDEAVKFVDILQNHFLSRSETYPERPLLKKNP